MSLKSRMAAIESALRKEGEFSSRRVLTPEERQRRLDWYMGLIGEANFDIMVSEFKQIPYEDGAQKLALIRKYYGEVKT